MTDTEPGKFMDDQRLCYERCVVGRDAWRKRWDDWILDWQTKPEMTIAMAKKAQIVELCNKKLRRQPQRRHASSAIPYTVLHSLNLGVASPLAEHRTDGVLPWSVA